MTGVYEKCHESGIDHALAARDSAAVDVYFVVLRIVHILGGAFWVGAATVFALFIEPTAKELGAPGGAFMGHLAQRRKLPLVIAISSILTIAAGALLYWRDSAGLKAAWITSDMGLGLTVGALAAIGSFLVGFTVLRPAIDRMGALLAGGGAQAEIARLATRLERAGKLNLALLFVAVVAMASARYL